LKQFAQEGRNVTAKKGPSFAPSEFGSHADAKGISRQAFRQSMDRLLKAGKIREETYGPPSRLRSRLTITGD
jgi:hypothetical protein